MGPSRKPLPSITARPVTTALKWADLVIDPATRAQIDKIRAGMKQSRELRSGGKRTGYRVLFHGPSGTGKTLTAALLGQELAAPVYRVDLSSIVSKYLGETEKNLDALFAEAESLDAILLLDEADALFGQRTSVTDAHDRYANQEISYLLQRIEDYSGLVILASNMRSNLDDAFVRRLQTIIEFPKPNAEQRRQLWQNALGAKAQPSPEVDLTAIADAHELTGGQIATVARLAALAAEQQPDKKLSLAALIESIRPADRKPRSRQ